MTRSFGPTLRQIRGVNPFRTSFTLDGLAGGGVAPRLAACPTPEQLQVLVEQEQIPFLQLPR